MFECHITVPTDDEDHASLVAAQRAWKTSEIARDPLLGNKNYFYLTKHSKWLAPLQEDMHDTMEVLRGRGVTVLREKIEVIIHDVRHV